VKNQIAKATSIWFEVDLSEVDPLSEFDQLEKYHQKSVYIIIQFDLPNRFRVFHFSNSNLKKYFSKCDFNFD
jgi:hypothetical protein